MFGGSGLYHRWRWHPRWRPILRRVDHSTIFVFIAATYTPLMFNVLDGWWRIGVLVAIWICAVAGVAGAAPFLRIPRQLLAGLYLAMGWVAVVALVPLTAALGWVAAVCLVTSWLGLMGLLAMGVIALGAPTPVAIFGVIVLNIGLAITLISAAVLRKKAQSQPVPSPLPAS